MNISPGTVIVTAHHDQEYDEHQEEAAGDSVDDGGGERDGDRVVGHDIDRSYMTYQY